MARLCCVPAMTAVKALQSHQRLPADLARSASVRLDFHAVPTAFLAVASARFYGRPGRSLSTNHR
jgi:hypothetical protein